MRVMFQCFSAFQQLCSYFIIFTSVTMCHDFKSQGKGNKKTIMLIEAFPYEVKNLLVINFCIGNIL
jgi:hypothetical protein